MDRTSTLPGGCKNLSDIVCLMSDKSGEFSRLTLAAALKRAEERHSRLEYLWNDEDGAPMFRLIDDAVLKRLRNQ